MAGVSPSSPRGQLARRKAQRALFLRTVLRYSMQRIADSTLPCPSHEPDGMAGCTMCVTPMYASRGAASKVINKALSEEFPLDAAAKESMRREQLETLNVALARIMRDLLNGKVSPGDRARAANALERLLARQAKLTGLDAPARVVVTEDLDMQIDEALEALLSQPGDPSVLS